MLKLESIPLNVRRVLIPALFILAFFSVGGVVSASVTFGETELSCAVTEVSSRTTKDGTTNSVYGSCTGHYEKYSKLSDAADARPAIGSIYICRANASTTYKGKPNATEKPRNCAMQ